MYYPASEPFIHHAAKAVMTTIAVIAAKVSATKVQKRLLMVSVFMMLDYFELT